MNGTIEKVIVQKSYGFINGDNGQQYFFHRDDYMGSWDTLCAEFGDHGNRNANVKVTFETISTPKGPRARKVSRS